MSAARMDGEKRRREIVEILNGRDTPVSGADLSRRLGVSRQVVVQDIALLRADHKEIMSTNKGYLIYRDSGEKELHRRVFCTSHATEETLAELCAIVDFGGRVLDVSVEHELYGQIQVDLIIENRLDAEEFVERMRKGKDFPLKALTGDLHYHTVIAASEKNLNRIEEELRTKGFLAGG